MSDSVHYLTNENTGTPSLSSGVNGFQFPSEFTGATGPGTEFPVATTLQEAVKLRWRIKKWAITSDFEVNDGTSSFTIPTTPFELDVSMAGPATREFDIMRATGIFSATFAGDGYSVVVEISGRLIDDSGTFYPYNTLSVAMQTADTSGNSASIDASTTTLPGSTGSITATLDGNEIAMLIKETTTGIGTTVATSFSIDPVEYWPYAAADGSPIYNVVSGAQLQNPQN